MRFYDIDGEPLDDDEAVVLFDDPEYRIIAQTSNDDVMVSTVLTMIDYGFGRGPPLIFETMIFGGPHDQQQWRYHTKEQALEGHQEVCKLAFSDWLTHR